MKYFHPPSSKKPLFVKTALSNAMAHDVLIPLLLVLLMGLAAGCGESPESKPLKAPEVQSSIENVLVLYNWEEYLGRHTLEQFREQTGITVELHTYQDDEEILAALQSGAIAPDLIILSAPVAMEMAAARLLKEMDMDALPNAAHIARDSLAPDPKTGRHHFIPYLMGTTGFLVNAKHVPDHGQSWKLMWDERLKGRMAMLDTPFEVIAAAAKMLGYPINPLPEQIGSIREALWRQKPLLAGYMDRIALMEKMIAGELWAAQMYSGDGLMSVEQNQDLAFVIPEEGCAAWVDVFVLPLSSANPQAALAFIDFVHTPEIMGQISSELWAATPNLAARKHVASEVLASPIAYPPPSALDQCEYFGGMGGAESVRLRIKLWAELTADN